MERVTVSQLVEDYLSLLPKRIDYNLTLELEAKLTNGKIPLSKIDYNNIIAKLIGKNYKCKDSEGTLMLRMSMEELNKKTGRFQMSYIRVEIEGQSIRDYCKTNEISPLLNNGGEIQLVEKSNIINNKKYFSAINDDYNLKVDLRGEKVINKDSQKGINFVENWRESKKTYRLINRVEFRQEDNPCIVHLSIVKQQYTPSFTLQQSNLFDLSENYEVEIEIDNSLALSDREKTKDIFKKTIQDVLCGIQNTDFPISIREKENVLKEYYRLINQKQEDKVPRYLYNSHQFIGPSSVTLHQKHIIEPNDNIKAPNIRINYTVTEKTDGDRCLLFISDRKIYFINNRMNVTFSGCLHKTRSYNNTIIDGEYVRFDKKNNLLNAFYAFDIYFLYGEDVRDQPFFVDEVFDDLNKTEGLCRYGDLAVFMTRDLNPIPFVESESCVKFYVKTFYPKVRGQTIFESCNEINKRIDLFEYNTDGLVFTPMDLGVGSVGELDRSGKVIIPNTKTTWIYSLKWKPEKYNTVDFLVTTKKNDSNEDEVTPIFLEGTDLTKNVQIEYYKTLVLRCGYSQKKHGYLNPWKDLLEDKVVTGREDEYKPVRFFPTEPSDVNAGLVHMPLKKDSKGSYVMKTEEDDVFQDNTIVEFYYNKNDSEFCRWKPLRLRYDKTADFKHTGKNFGNDYAIANDNWHSINRPVTEKMIYHGEDIPSLYTIEESVYYNTSGSTNFLKNLRKFHNVVKTKLMNVAKRNDILIDYACGKGGDLPKWERAKLFFVFGIDISKDNLENRLDGSCARYLNMKKNVREIPGALFVLGDASRNIKTNDAMLDDKSKIITSAVFGKIPKKNLDKTVDEYYGVGKNGFDVSSCQFAIHYMFKDKISLVRFLQNVSECTKVNGYFIGTCYDGETIFHELQRKKMNESLVIKNDGIKIWSITKKYEETTFAPDETSVGFKISVFQESINNEIDEYLVNFSYLVFLIEKFGFTLISRKEAESFGLKNGTNMFRSLYDQRDNLSTDEKKISFLNRYFIFKKVFHVNTQELTKILLNEEVEVEKEPAKKKEKIMEEDVPELNIEKLVQEIEAEPKTDVIKIKKAKICQCINANGVRCTNKVKVTKENPNSKYCGLHTNCKNEPDVPNLQNEDVDKVIIKAKRSEKNICQCKKANGEACTNKVKVTKENPNSKYCGLHTNCKNPTQAQEIQAELEEAQEEAQKEVQEIQAELEAQEVKEVAELEAAQEVKEVQEVAEVAELEAQDEPVEDIPNKIIIKTKRAKKETEGKTKRVIKICECMKANGERCSAKARPDSKYCGTHANCKKPMN
uniref:mRNA (guanine-N(7))-methyltransferase n=1 Tax=viral metagenome TaxID=1070528 RepID=A0A6C0HR25_9ZZZZ